MDMSVIIVNYNCAPYVQSCVRSLREECGSEIAIIVVDNASDQANRDMLVQLLEGFGCEIILSPENRGFAAGCNIGAQAANSSWFHFLNPDCTVETGLRAAYHALIQSSENAIYTTKIYNENGKLQGNNYAVPFFGNLVRTYLGLGSVRWAQGSSILISRANFSALGGWDESYFMYAEDLDFCYRAHLQGLPLRTISANVVHVGGASSSKTWTNFERERKVFRAQYLFFRKHASVLEYSFVMPLLILRSAIIERKRPVFAFRAFLASFGG